MSDNLRLAMLLGMCGVFLACAACNRNMAEPTAGGPVTTAEETARVSEDGKNTTSIGATLTAQVRGAVADLAARTGVSEDAITVYQARRVHWSSGAVGCPKPGMNYTQAIVPGVLVLLEADGVTYRYHGRAEGALFHCPHGRAQEPAYGPGQDFM